MEKKYCFNCGTKVVPNAKFCYECGIDLNKVDSLENNSNSEVNSDFGKRQQEYAGKIIKCPNCGATITHRTIECPECGYRISDNTATSSITDFNNRMTEIENERTSEDIPIWKTLLSFDLMNSADKKKISLIESYPIPNNIDDIMDFMIMSYSNIDVDLTKDKWWRKNASGRTPESLSVRMSLAWLTMMRKTYQKAKGLFPNEPEFEKIKEMYVGMHQKLNMTADL